jgi:hypothetical protein
LTTFRSQLDVFLLVQRNPKQARRGPPTGEGVAVVQDGELEPAVKEGRDFDVVLEQDAVRVVRGWVPRFNDRGHQAAEEDPVPDGKRPVGPVEVVDEAMGEAIGRLLEVDRERDIVAEIVRGAERREKSVKRDRSVVSHDRDVDTRSVKV